ncbi:MAG TPA: hypothetical protein VFB59_01425 [Candidatus Saccharimonadales bacterium]|nr:hypothetical protein [Candidatus Saccharimonadales bacterium]
MSEQVPPEADFAQVSDAVAAELAARSETLPPQWGASETRPQPGVSNEQ